MKSRKSVRLFLVQLLLVALLLPMISTAAFAEEAPNKYTYMVSINSKYGDPNEMFLYKKIEKMFNIDLEITAVSADGWTEKRNLAFATNDLPDIMTGLSGNDLATYGSQGILLTLNDYINEELTPNIIAAFEKVPDLGRAHYFPDGNIYAVFGFNFKEREIPNRRFWINKKWAENLGVKVPETLDEYYDYLVAVRDGDADGDGDATNEIPLGGRYDITTYNPSESNYQILAAFGFLKRDIQVVDGVVQYNAVHDNYKEYLKFMNKLYAEGLLDSEYFTQSADQLTAKIGAASVASFTDDAQWLYGEMTQEEVYSQWEGTVPFTSEFNDTPIWGGNTCLVLRNIAITDNVEDPTELMGMIDWLYTEDGYNTNWNGPALGEWDEYPEVGWYYEDGSDMRHFAFPDEYGTTNDYVHDLCSDWSFPCSQWTDEPTADAKDANLSYNMNTFYTPYSKDAYPSNARFTDVEADETSLLKTDIDNYFYEMEAKMITGEYDIDATWDSYVEGMNQRGVPRLVEVYQAAYDRYMAN